MRIARWIALAALACSLAACLPGRGGAPSPSASASLSPVAVVTTAAPAPTAAPPATPTPAGTVYTVKPGDTLSAIAADKESTIDAISKANQLTDPDKLQVGQKLVIPAAGSASAATASSSSALPPPASKPPPP